MTRTPKTVKSARAPAGQRLRNTYLADLVLGPAWSDQSVSFKEGFPPGGRRATSSSFCDHFGGQISISLVEVFWALLSLYFELEQNYTR